MFISSKDYLHGSTQNKAGATIGSPRAGLVAPRHPWGVPCKDSGSQRLPTSAAHVCSRSLASSLPRARHRAAPPVGTARPAPAPPPWRAPSSCIALNPKLPPPSSRTSSVQESRHPNLPPQPMCALSPGTAPQALPMFYESPACLPSELKWRAALSSRVPPTAWPPPDRWPVIPLTPSTQHRGTVLPWSSLRSTLPQALCTRYSPELKRPPNPTPHHCSGLAPDHPPEGVQCSHSATVAPAVP